jgi:prolipoprotein diacylglyceryl transferase
VTELFIPSPSFSAFHLGPITIRMYALCIIAGVIVGSMLASRRWVARGGSRDAVETVALVAVPFGIVGARLYHVITDYQLYFGPGRNPIEALYIWRGGLGIWGGVALGALGAYLVARRRRIRFAALADAFAPGIVLAQAIGRLGNWFNQELYGRPSTLPWAVSIDPEYRVQGFEQYATYHPTFLYELLWNLGVCAALILLDRRFKLGHGKVFALYVMFYTAGRAWIEHLRIDPANQIAGIRINDYVSVALLLIALIWLVYLIRTKPGREEVVEGDFRYIDGRPPSSDGAERDETAKIAAADAKDRPDSAK